MAELRVTERVCAHVQPRRESVYPPPSPVSTLYLKLGGVILTVFYLSTLLVHILMLNALIAIMGNTYNRVSEAKQQRGLLNRAQYILERERLMSKRMMRDRQLFPK